MKTYTTAEAAEILHVTPQTLARYITRGELRASRIGKAYIIEAESLETFIRAAEVKAAKKELEGAPESQSADGGEANP